MPDEGSSRRRGRRVNPGESGFAARIAAENLASLRARLEHSRPADRRAQQLTERELMALAYACLGERGRSLAFDEIEVVSEAAKPAATGDRSSETRARAASGSSRGRARSASPSPRDVEPPDHVNKLRELAQRAWTGSSWKDAAPADDDRVAEDRARLASAQRCEPLPQLNVRRLPLHDALELVAEFVQDAQKSRQRFVRVITGKGIGSRGDPVIKPFVEAWCRSQTSALVLGWTPEREPTGEYGSLIVELRCSTSL